MADVVPHHDSPGARLIDRAHANVYEDAMNIETQCKHRAKCPTAPQRAKLEVHPMLHLTIWPCSIIMY